MKGRPNDWTLVRDDDSWRRTARRNALLWSRLCIFTLLAIWWSDAG